MGHAVIFNQVDQGTVVLSGDGIIEDNVIGGEITGNCDTGEGFSLVL